MHTQKTARSANRLIVLILVFTMLAFGLLSFKDSESFNVEAPVFGVIACALLLITYVLLLIFFPSFDRLLFVVNAFLLSLGLIIQYRMAPSNCKSQLIMLAVGTIIMFAAMLCVKSEKLLKKLTIPAIVLSLGLLAVLLILGKEKGGAKNWIFIGGRSFQPSEFVKLACVLVVARYLDKNVRLFGLFVPILFVGSVAMLLVAEKDLGAAMLICFTVLIVYFAATGKVIPTLFGLGVGAGGAILSYYLFDHVRKRIEVWKDPFKTYDSSGYQIVQGLMAIASGGAFGLGLGLGSPKDIPAYHTDYIFAVICEEFGLVAGVLLIAFYVLFIIRGLLISINARTRFLSLIALGCTVLITLQSFIIIGGVIKLIPLTGITLPFVSYGGSSMIACMLNVGVLQGIAADSVCDARKQEVGELD